VINRLLDAGEQFIGNMTTRKYVGMSKCSKVTASRDLADLVSTKAYSKKTAGGGRSTSYILYMDVKPNTGNEHFLGVRRQHSYGHVVFGKNSGSLTPLHETLT
jgi:hypothetical protein